MKLLAAERVYFVCLEDEVGASCNALDIPLLVNHTDFLAFKR